MDNNENNNNPNLAHRAQDEDS